MSDSQDSTVFFTSMFQFLMLSKQKLAVVAREYDLTPMQAMTLLLTDTVVPRPMNAFKKLYNCDASNVTGIVDGLQEKSFVERSEDPEDRRIKVVMLTHLGAETKKLISNQITTMDDGLLSPLTKDEQVKFKDMINKLSIGNYNL